MNMNQRVVVALNDVVGAAAELNKAITAYYRNQPSCETVGEKCIDLVLAQSKYDKACVALDKIRAERKMARCAAILNQ